MEPHPTPPSRDDREHESTEHCKPVEELGDPGDIPCHLNVTSEPEAIEEIEGTVAYNLISHVGIAYGHILGLRWVHIWQINSPLRRESHVVPPDRRSGTVLPDP